MFGNRITSSHSRHFMKQYLPPQEVHFCIVMNINILFVYLQIIYLYGKAYFNIIR